MADEAVIEEAKTALDEHEQKVAEQAEAIKKLAGDKDAVRKQAEETKTEEAKVGD